MTNVQQLWIWSNTHKWWTNGKSKINTDIQFLDFDLLDRAFFKNTGQHLCKFAFTFTVFTTIKRQLAAEAWKPKTPEEIAEILNG